MNEVRETGACPILGAITEVFKSKIRRRIEAEIEEKQKQIAVYKSDKYKELLNPPMYSKILLQIDREEREILLLKSLL